MDWVDVVSRLGFPVAAAILLLWYVLTKFDARLAQLDSRLARLDTRLTQLIVILAKATGVDFEEVKKLAGNGDAA